MSAPCPCCGQRIVTADDILAMADERRRAAQWIGGNDTGTSSKTIWRVMTGCPSNAADTPSDRGDFGRCHRLLKLMPEWRARLGEVATEHAMWRPFVEAWARLEAAYDASRWREVGDSLDECNRLRLEDYYRRTGRAR